MAQLRVWEGINKTWLNILYSDNKANVAVKP